MNEGGQPEEKRSDGGSGSLFTLSHSVHMVLGGLQ